MVKLKRTLSAEGTGTATALAIETPREAAIEIPENQHTTESDPQAADSLPEHDEIAMLAYFHWEARGCRGGSPEEDWIRAEEEIRNRG